MSNSPRTRLRADKACGSLAESSLCDAAVQVLIDLVLDSGGVSDQEALLLLAILARLERLQSTEGPKAALAAAREIRDIWLEGDPAEAPGLLN